MGKSHVYSDVDMERFDHDSDDDISLHIRTKVEAEPTVPILSKKTLFKFNSLRPWKS